jgi:Zn-dependent protease with chaperone function
MITTIRAAISVAMLLGFYALALGIVGALGWLTVWLWQDHSGPGVAKLGYITVAVAVGIVVAFWRVLRAKPGPPLGVPLTEAQAPEVWRMVRELARTADTRPPDEIRLIPMVNAAVNEDARLLGLVGGRRRLYLGIPLLLALTVGQLRSVVGHELGHYSRRHTRLGEIAYRGRQAVLATVAQLSGRLVGWVLRQYAKVYLLVAAAVSRRQELEADQLSVRIAGRATAQSALRELPVIDTAWGFYERRYLDPGWEAGYAPVAADFFGGFAHLLTARAEELADLRAGEPPTEQSKWDTHPAIAVRIAAMERMPDAGVPADDRPASVLLGDIGAAATAVAVATVEFGGRAQLPWAEFRAVSTQAVEQRTADDVYRAAARFTGAAEAGLGEVLGIVAAGRVGEFAATLAPGVTGREAAERFAGRMSLLLRVAAVRAGVASRRESWTGQADLVGRDGGPLDLTELARLATDQATVADATARLAALGIDVAAVRVEHRVATAHGGQIIDGIANCLVDGNPFDLLVLDNGLIIIPCPKKTDGGKARLRELAGSAPVVELAAKGQFLPYEEIAQAEVVKSTPIRVRLGLRGGRTVDLREQWASDRLTRRSDDALREALARHMTQPA